MVVIMKAITQNYRKEKYAIYLVVFIISVISKWIKDGMNTPAEKIANLGLPFFPHKKK